MDIPIGGRRVRVPGDRTYLVPRYIQRIDSDRHQMHGWQVRFKGSTAGATKFYSDKKCDGVANSLEAARVMLRRYLEDHPPPKTLDNR